MSDPEDLYQQVIVDHSRRPRNFRPIEGTSRKAEGYNPLCGDKVTIYVSLEGETVRDVAFQGTGCAISTASASLLTESLKGKTLAEAGLMFDRFHELVTRGGPPPAGLGKLLAFAGVSEYPTRVKCATLPWHTLRAALKNVPEVVSTE
jgi:nitrogen fixation NifU-like protein